MAAPKKSRRSAILAELDAAITRYFAELDLTPEQKKELLQSVFVPELDWFASCLSRGLPVHVGGVQEATMMLAP